MQERVTFKTRDFATPFRRTTAACVGVIERLHNQTLALSITSASSSLTLFRNILDWKFIFMLTLSLCFPIWAHVVRKDLEVVKHTSYNSTQEMFLAQVGIQNSFSEDQEGS